MSLSFRLADASDAERIATLVNSAYRGESSRSGWTTEAALLDGQRTDAELVRSIVSDPNKALLLAFDGQHLIGSATLEKYEGRCYLGMLTVDPQRQAKGLGRAILREAEIFARDQWRFSALRMTVISVREELLAYYARRGYLPTGEIKPFPMDDPRFGIPKRRDFHLTVLEKPLPSADPT